MTPLRQRMLDALQLGGFSERTREAYVGAVQRLALHYKCSPDELSSDEVQQFKRCGLTAPDPWRAGAFRACWMRHPMRCEG